MVMLGKRSRFWTSSSLQKTKNQKEFSHILSEPMLTN